MLDHEIAAAALRSVAQIAVTQIEYHAAPPNNAPR